MSARARWWLPIVCMAAVCGTFGVGWFVAWSVADLGGAAFAAGVAYIAWAQWILFARHASRSTFKYGWFVGYQEGAALRDELERSCTPVPLVRQGVTGDPAPEPWDAE